MSTDHSAVQAAPHSAKPAEDLEDRRAVRFFLRGERDLIPCLVDWDVLDALEDGPAASRSERLGRFEVHRRAIEAAALRRLRSGASAEDGLTVSEDEIREAAEAS